MASEDMKLSDAVKKACEEPSLPQALAWIAIWETERVVRYVREHPNQPWETCFRVCLTDVLGRYTTVHGAVPGYDPSVEEKDPFEICAGECDAQADGIQESIDHGDYGGLDAARSEMSGRLYGLREMAAHLRALGCSRREAATAPLRRSAVSYVERSDGRILCVWNRRYGGWSLPGGMVEDGESVEQAQERELREETGLETEYREPMFEGPVDPTVRATADARTQVIGRATHCHVFAVCARGFWREREPGCPVTWLTRQEFLSWSPFARFYARVFAECPPRPRVDEGGEYQRGGVEALLRATRRIRARVLDLRDEYRDGVRDEKKPGDGVVAALHQVVEAINAELGPEQVVLSNDERRARTTTIERGSDVLRVDQADGGYLRLRPAPEGACCTTHEWPTQGLPKRLVEELGMRRYRGGGLNACRDCVDRMRAESNRERLAVVP